MPKTPVQFELNGQDRAEFVEAGATLLTVLREKIGVLSPKPGCLQGTCGCCTVLIDGEPMLACLTLAEACGGKHVETVESLEQGSTLHPLQKAFMEHFAAQCGYCTSGMLMAAKALLDRKPQPTRDEILDAISGNICRCTGYTPIVDAIMSATGTRGAAYRTA